MNGVDEWIKYFDGVTSESLIGRYKRKHHANPPHHSQSLKFITNNGEFIIKVDMVYYFFHTPDGLFRLDGLGDKLVTNGITIDMFEDFLRILEV